MLIMARTRTSLGLFAFASLTACAASPPAPTAIRAQPLDPAILCRVHEVRIIEGDPQQVRSRTKEGISLISSALQDCYEHSLARNINTKGRVLFEMTIQADGAVRNLCVRSSQIQDNEAVQCMLTTLRALNTNQAALDVDVMLPLNFQPEQQGTDSATQDRR